MVKSPDFSIIIPTHSRCQMLSELLQQLQTMNTPNCEIIVIDDASSDGTAQMLTSFPDVRVLRNDEPKGFNALPEATQIARGNLILQLDDDACPVEGTLERIMQHFRKRGSQLGLIALPFQEPESGRLSYTTYFPKLRGNQAYVPTRGFHAGAVAARREACLEVPLSPANYFMYGTEVPTVIEFLNAGWEADYLPDAPVIHKWNARSRKVSSRAAFYSLRNDLVTIQRYYRGWRRWEMLAGRKLAGLFHLGASGRPQDVLEASKSAQDILNNEGQRDISQDILKRIYPAFEGVTLSTFFSESNFRRLGWFLGFVPIDQIC